MSSLDCDGGNASIEGNALKRRRTKRRRLSNGCMPRGLGGRHDRQDWQDAGPRHVCFACGEQEEKPRVRKKKMTFVPP